MNRLDGFELLPEAHELATVALGYISLHHAEKPYHNHRHTLSVMGWASNLARQSDLHERDRSLVVVATAYHDYIHGPERTPGDNERLSAEIATDHLTRNGQFEETEVERVATMILGTIMEKRDGKLIQRAAASSRIEDRIVADADLSMLGSPYRFLQAATETLLRERHPDAHPRGTEMYHLLGVTLELLEQEPLTDAAKELLPHRPENYARIASMRQTIALELDKA